MNRYHSLLTLSLLTFISISHAAQSKPIDPPPLALVYCLADFEGQQTLFSIQIPPESNHHTLQKAIEDYINKKNNANNDTTRKSVDIQFKDKTIKNRRTVAKIIASSQAINSQIGVTISKGLLPIFFPPFLWAKNRTVFLNNHIHEQIAESLEKTVQCELINQGATIKPAKR